MPRKRASKKAVSRRVFGHFSERPKNPLRVGLDARGSTHDQQTLPLQRRAMRDYVGRRGWTIAADIKEVGSGASVRELRQKLLEAARRRDIDVVVVWRLEPLGTIVDRLGHHAPGTRRSRSGWTRIWAP